MEPEVNMLAQGCLSFSNSWHSTSQPLKPQMCAHPLSCPRLPLPSGQAVLQTPAAPRINLQGILNASCFLMNPEAEQTRAEQAPGSSRPPRVQLKWFPQMRTSHGKSKPESHIWTPEIGLQGF